MNYFHVAIIEDSEECLVSRTETGLRNQVTKSMTDRFLVPPTDDEWSFYVLADEAALLPLPIRSEGFAAITYYKTLVRSDA